jgi:lambda family phage portal protein
MSKRESRKPLDFKPNLADKVIGYFAPKVALRNMQARAVMALASGSGNGVGYDGASRSKSSMSNWGAHAGSAEADISPDLVNNRARSRDLVRNNPIAGGAVGQMVTNVIGTGLSLSAKPDADYLGLTDDQADEWAINTAREFNLWANSKDCDLRRVLNFYQLQELVFRSRFESGDVFVNTPMKKRGNPYDLTLQVIEADRCNNPNRAVNSDKIIDGVELDADGAPTQYHFSERHPGDFRKTNSNWKALPAFDKNGRRRVFHLFKQIRPEQVRGVPEFAPIIEPLKQLGRFTEAELQAAVVNGMFAMFVRMDHEAFMDIFDDTGRKNYADNAGQWDGNLDSNGRVINLLPGEEPVSPNPGRPNSEFDPFVQSIMRQIGMQLEIPYEVLIMHFQSSYSAARAALLAAWKTYRKWRDWMSSDFCQPVYELFLEESVAKGRIKAAGFFASPLTRAAWSKAIWIGDGPGSIDPSKEVGAAKDRIDIGISTRETESILHDGVDYKTKHKQLAKEKKMRDDDGLTMLPSNGDIPITVKPEKPDTEDDE